MSTYFSHLYKHTGDSHGQHSGSRKVQQDLQAFHVCADRSTHCYEFFTCQKRTCTHSDMYICTCIHTRIHPYTHAYIHTNTHTSTHTCTAVTGHFSATYGQMMERIHCTDKTRTTSQCGNLEPKLTYWPGPGSI